MDINVHAYENGGEHQSMRMNDCPELYHSNCDVTRQDAKHALSQYKDRIKWKEFGDRSIDLGCADGGVTAVLESFLPPNYESLTGIDVNQKMVEFANKNYGNSRWNFKVFDMEGELPRDMVNAYDHVFSFYTMHWIRKQKKAFGNIHGMIADGGDCFLTFLAFHPTYSIYQALAATDKWKTYIHDVEDFVSPYHECVEPDTVIFKMMADIGFKDIDVKCKQRTHYFNNIENFTNILLAINPYCIPKHLLEEFVKDIEKITRDMRLVHLNSNNVEIVKCHYNLMVVYAQK